MKLTYGVITWVPDPEKSDGNLYTGFAYQPGRVIHGLENFTLGEILLLNENGREFCGRGRKPSKWFVTCEEFDTLKKAITRVNELGEGKLGEAAE